MADIAHRLRPLRRPVRARRRGSIAGLALALTPALAAAQATLPAVTVSGRLPAPPGADVAGFGDVPPERLPLSVRSVEAQQLLDAGARRLADLVASQPGVSDAYNAEGYWDQLSVRGFVLDQRFNYRREGLPINAETSIPLDNKARVEVLEGASGIQAGTSAPGGLVNLVVKRPDDVERRSLLLGWRERGSLLGAVDLSTRFGADRAFGLRLNLASERLDPLLRDARGQRRLAALATDWRFGPDTLIEAEIESSRRSQPRQPGFSLLGDRVPDARAIDPRINLNDQPWSLPVVLEGTTGTLRWQQRLSSAWRLKATLGTQRLTSDDRVAFPFGCSAEGRFDRYCSDGSFDLYDFRSDNERRRSDGLDVVLHGSLETGGVSHALTLGALRSSYRTDFKPQVYNRTLDALGNEAGLGHIDGSLVAFPNTGVLSPMTNLREFSTELYANDALRLGPRWTAWLGLRHTRLARSSIDTDGGAATSYRQSFTTPWAALGYALDAATLVYASWGQGIESEVVPNRARFTNAGQALPAERSRQTEVGAKHAGDAVQWTLAAFEIVQPRFASVGSDCFDDTAGNTCTRQADGEQRHRGLEGEWHWRASPGFALDAGAMLLDAKVHGTSDPTLDDQRPTNVPRHTLKLGARYRPAAVAGLELSGGLVHEGRREALPDGSASIPGWTRLDAALKWEQRIGGVATTLRAGIDNVLDRRAWRESPFQFEHAYLYPLAPRTAWVSLQLEL